MEQSTEIATIRAQNNDLDCNTKETNFNFQAKRRLSILGDLIEKGLTTNTLMSFDKNDRSKDQANQSILDNENIMNSYNKDENLNNIREADDMAKQKRIDLQNINKKINQKQNLKANKLINLSARYGPSPK